MLIGNKKDRMQREVTFTEGAEYARRNNFGFMEVSAKTGNGVRDAYYRLILEVYQQID